jgi:hypothetical protein
MGALSMIANVFAYTATDGDRPEFVSVNRRSVDDRLSITVRSAKENGGEVATIALDRAKAREMALAIIIATN